MTETVKEKAIRLWVSGLSSGQIAAEIGTSRNCVVGYVFRAGKKLLAETGVNPYARPDHSFNTRNGLRYPEGYVPRAPKVQRPRPATVKPPQIKRVITEKDVTPGAMLPPLVRLDSRLWVPLPGTAPKDLMDLDARDCRWPIGEGNFTFCAESTPEGSSYCVVHTRWGLSKKPLAPLNFNKRAA